MSATRYDLDAMKKSLEKNHSDLKQLSRTFCPKNSMGIPYNAMAIANLHDRVHALHNLMGLTTPENGESEEEFERSTTEALEIMQEFSKRIDTYINELIISFPENKRAEVRLITGSMKNNYAATLNEVPTVFENIRQTHFKVSQPEVGLTKK